jgi:hypothetical protein
MNALPGSGTKAGDLKASSKFWVGGITPYNTTLLGWETWFVTCDKSELNYFKSKHALQSPVAIASLTSKDGKQSLQHFISSCLLRLDIPAYARAAHVVIETYRRRLSGEVHHPTLLTPQEGTDGHPPPSLDGSASLKLTIH